MKLKKMLAAGVLALSVLGFSTSAFAAGNENKTANIIKLIVLLLLICYIIYFLVMWFQYVAPIKHTAEEDTTSSVAEYDRYVNEHVITTTPNYTVAEAKAYLKQVIKDNYKDMGYTSDPSSSSIDLVSSNKKVNNQECYEFTVAGKTFDVSKKLAAAYLNNNGTYVPYTFHGTEELPF